MTLPKNKTNLAGILRSQMNCTTIILAGGLGMRMGRLSKLLPKPALVIYDEPLLLRLINQLCEAGFTRVLISTNPMHCQHIKTLVNRVLEIEQISDDANAEIRVISNESHTLGPLEALSVAMRETDTDRCLLCLGDIFFLGNPFMQFARELDSSADYLGIADPVGPRDLLQGGLAYCHGEVITALVERPESISTGAMRWSGTALFSRRLMEDLEKFLSGFPANSPIGDMFEFRRKCGRVLRSISVPDFVNINSTTHLMLACLYAGAQAHRDHSDVCNVLLHAAESLRQVI